MSDEHTRTHLIIPSWEDVSDERDYWVNRAITWEERTIAAERRIAAALACHTRETVQGLPGEEFMFTHYCDECGDWWDTTLDRCSSPTVTALVGEQ